jgi:hypothetical protein
VLALAAAIIWSIADRGRGHYARLHHYLRIVSRYTLAAIIIQYASVKIFKTQFPYPSLDQLLVRYGYSSPIGLLWTMMGYSTL